MTDQPSDLQVRAERAESALLAIVYALGPERLCRCTPGDPNCGLRDEAQHALDVARGHLAHTPYGLPDSAPDDEETHP